MKFVTAVPAHAQPGHCDSVTNRCLRQAATIEFSFFDVHDSSSLDQSRGGDVQAVRGFVDGVILKVLTVVLSLAVYLAYMLSMHVPLALACLITSPLLWIGAVWFSRAVRRNINAAASSVIRWFCVCRKMCKGFRLSKGLRRGRRDRSL